jgi:hypothetical protein
VKRDDVPEPVRQNHLHVARSNVLKARHYVMFFGKPIAEFTAEHNRARREQNDRTVRAYAVEGGKFARYADVDPMELYALLPSGAPGRELAADDRVVRGLVDGWCDTDELLSELADTQKIDALAAHRRGIRDGETRDKLVELLRSRVASGLLGELPTLLS